jgi:hypothetical protein
MTIRPRCKARAAGLASRAREPVVIQTHSLRSPDVLGLGLADGTQIRIVRRTDCDASQPSVTDVLGLDPMEVTQRSDVMEDNLTGHYATKMRHGWSLIWVRHRLSEFYFACPVDARQRANDVGKLVMRHRAVVTHRGGRLRQAAPTFLDLVSWLGRNVGTADVV